MNKLFSEFILIALGKRQTFRKSPSEKDWYNIYEEVEKQSLIGFCFTVIERLPNNQRPGMNLLMEWVGQTEKIKVQNKIVNKRTAEISLLFQKGGYRSTVLKGQGAALLYPYPEYRQSGDIDIWIDGDRNKVLEYAKSFGVVGSIDIKHVDFHCYEDVSVEIHFMPTWFYNPIINKRFRKWLSFVKNRQFNRTDFGFSVPTIGFNLVYSLIHIYRHLFEEGIGLRQLMDYYYILIHSTVEERRVAFAHLCDFGMFRFVAAVMYVQKNVFDLDESFLLCSPSNKYGRKLMDDIIRGGNFGHYNEKNQHGYENRIQRGIRNIRHNMNILFDYPSEVLWSPVWKCWHWCWRKKHGYL